MAHIKPLFCFGLVIPQNDLQRLWHFLSVLIAELKHHQPYQKQRRLPGCCWRNPGYLGLGGGGGFNPFVPNGQNLDESSPNLSWSKHAIFQAPLCPIFEVIQPLYQLQDWTDFLFVLWIAASILRAATSCSYLFPIKLKSKPWTSNMIIQVLSHQPLLAESTKAGQP